TPRRIERARVLSWLSAMSCVPERRAAPGLLTMSRDSAAPEPRGAIMVQASAIFDSHGEAERAVSELRRAGVSDADLSAIAHHGNTTTTSTGDGEITDEHHRNVLRGILGGGALGAGLGVAALAIPGVGPLAAAGAIAASALPEAVAIGAGVGALGGTLNEVLTKHGVSDEDATYYGGRLKNGGVVVTVSGSSIEANLAREILYRNGGHNASQSRTMAG